jgi:hypothetical protein
MMRKRVVTSTRIALLEARGERRRHYSKIVCTDARGPSVGGQRRMEQYVPPKHWYLPTSPYSVTTHKTNIDFFSSMRVSNIIYENREAFRVRG